MSQTYCIYIDVDGFYVPFNKLSHHFWCDSFVRVIVHYEVKYFNKRIKKLYIARLIANLKNKQFVIRGIAKIINYILEIDFVCITSCH